MSVRGTVQWMRENYGDECRIDLVTIPLYAGGPRITCNIKVKDAMLALGHVLQKWGYLVRIAGCFNCRPNTSNPSLPSNHSWATALDINPDTNPYSPANVNKLITDMPSDMVREIENIKTKSGTKVFRWGGRYKTVKDAMHWEVIATPTELESGIDVGIGIVSEPTTWPTIRKGTNNTKAVKKLQQLLNITVDGIFGPVTEAHVINYQQSRGLIADGVVGPATWTALLNSIDATNISPTKGMA
jgi:peptidoglycan hydrolase-like protein with peptidoglycan-binding domain